MRKTIVLTSLFYDHKCKTLLMVMLASWLALAVKLDIKILSEHRTYCRLAHVSFSSIFSEILSG